jgi:hypothetical protein
VSAACDDLGVVGTGGSVAVESSGASGEGPAGARPASPPEVLPGASPPESSPQASRREGEPGAVAGAAEMDDAESSGCCGSTASALPGKAVPGESAAAVAAAAAAAAAAASSDRWSRVRRGSQSRSENAGIGGGGGGAEVDLSSADTVTAAALGAAVPGCGSWIVDPGRRSAEWSAPEAAADRGSEDDAELDSSGAVPELPLPDGCCAAAAWPPPPSVLPPAVPTADAAPSVDEEWSPAFDSWPPAETYDTEVSYRARFSPVRKGLQ